MLSLDCHKESNFLYANKNGHLDSHRVLPRRVFYGRSLELTDEQWWLEAMDLDIGDVLDFALKSIVVDG